MGLLTAATENAPPMNDGDGTQTTTDSSQKARDRAGGGTKDVGDNVAGSELNLGSGVGSGSSLATGTEEDPGSDPYAVEPEPPTTKEKPRHTLWKQVQGIIFTLLSAISFATSGYLAHILLKDKKVINASLIAVLRCSHLAIFCIAGLPFWQFVLHEQVFANVYPPAKNQFNILIVVLRGLCGGAGMLAFLFALMYISPGETTTIIYSNPVFVLIFARIFFKEPLGILRSVAAAIAIIGVILIAQPPGLGIFPDNSGTSAIARYKGIAFGVTAMLSMTTTILILRFLRNVHFLVINLSLAIVGFIVSVIITLVMNGFHISSVGSADVLLLLVGCTTTICAGLILQTLALKYLAASIFSVIRSSEVVFSFLLELLSNKYPDAFEYAGASLVIFSICCIGFQKYLMDLEPENKLRIKLKFLLR